MMGMEDVDKRQVQQPYVDVGTQFYRGTLRSGQTLESETGIVVVGDVNPGAAVMANGSIVVLGAVKGSVYAGLGGDEDVYKRQDPESKKTFRGSIELRGQMRD